MKSIKLIIIFLLTCLFINYVKMQADLPSVAGAPGSSQRTSRFAVIGGLIGFGYLFYKLQQWFFWESDENLIERVEDRYNRELSYHSLNILVDFFEKSFAIKISDLDDRESVLNQVKEQFLSEIDDMFPKNKYAYPETIFGVTASLGRSFQDLKKRIEYLSKLSSRTSKQNDALDKMIILENKINVDLPRLLLFSDYVKKYENYFYLYKKNKNTRNVFKEEIAIAQLQETPANIIIDQLKQCILGHSKGDYPLMEFVDKVDSHIEELKSDEKKLKYNYIQLMSNVAQTIKVLTWMRSVIMSDPRFVEEKRRSLEQKVLDLKEKKYKLAQYKQQMADLQRFMK